MRVLVTGGGGFLGTALVKQLHSHGVQVKSLSRRRHPHLDAYGVEQVIGDVADAAAACKAVADCEVVFHTAAMAGIWGPWEAFYRTNVLGTEQIIAACRRMGVRHLVYTSSPSVVATAGLHEGLQGVDESAPYPRRYLAHYPHTKALAEQAVRAANGTHLLTVSLRPHLIWGPGDPHLLPRLIARAQSGKLRRLGKANPLVDTIYVDNAAYAHILAAERLLASPREGGSLDGRAYFVSQGRPIPLWDMINRMLACANLPPVNKQFPARLAYILGWLLEKLYGRFAIKHEPPMTRFVAHQLSTPHWFDIGAAKRDLGYRATVSLEEGLSRLAHWYQNQTDTDGITGGSGPDTLRVADSDNPQDPDDPCESPSPGKVQAAA